MARKNLRKLPPVKRSLFLLALLTGLATQAQTTVTWSGEIKLHNRFDGLGIIAADQTGVYMEENTTKGFRWITEVIKLDPALNEVYRYQIDQELKGKVRERLFYVKGRLFLFAHQNVKQDGKKINMYAAEIDMTTGKFKTDWKLVHTWAWPEKGESFMQMIKISDDSSRMELSAIYAKKEGRRYELQTLDAGTMEPEGAPIVITAPSETRAFKVQDFRSIPGGNALMVGCLYDDPGDGTKKLPFKGFSVRVYSPDGKLIKDVNTDIQDKYLIDGKFTSLKNDIVLAAFYSNDKERRITAGMVVEHINPHTGEVSHAETKELDGTPDTGIEDDPADGKSRRTVSDDEAGFASNLRFKNFYLTPDNGVLVLAERYHEYRTIDNFMNPPKIFVNYDSRDIFMAKYNAGGAIEWLHVLPKAQFERSETGSEEDDNPDAAYTNDFIEAGESGPAYGGFGSIAVGGKVHLFFNDYTDNANVTELGQHVRRVKYYDKTRCYEVILDMVTGACTRREAFSNVGIPTAMPREGVIVGNMYYIMGEESNIAGRNVRDAVGKLTVN